MCGVRSKGVLAAAGKLNAVVVCFDLPLAEGVSLTSGIAMRLWSRVTCRKVLQTVHGVRIVHHACALLALQCCCALLTQLRKYFQGRLSYALLILNSTCWGSWYKN
jgi:hypothetical protein